MKRTLLILPLFLLWIDVFSQSASFYTKSALWFRSNELDTSEKHWKNIGKDSVSAESKAFCSLSKKI